jgi:UDP-N-acetylbacillosamine N-acetyltransferase
VEETITRLIILGAGGYGRTIEDLVEQIKTYDEILFLDDNSGFAVGTVAELESFIDTNTVFYPAIGNNELRCELIRRIQNSNGKVVSIIHPSAYVSPTAKIGIGVAILPHASVGTNVTIADGCIVNMNAIIDHDTVLEEGVHIAPGAIVKGENRITKYTKIESGTVVERGEYSV